MFYRKDDYARPVRYTIYTGPHTPLCVNGKFVKFETEEGADNYCKKHG